MGPRVFAGTAQGVYATSNGGLSWEERKAGLPAFEVRALVRHGTKLMAGTYGGGTYLSSDSGATWTAAKTGLSGNYVRSLLVEGSNIFAGISGTGAIDRTTDDGGSWTAVSTGMNFYTVIQALSAGPGYLYAAPQGLSVWRRPLSEVLVGLTEPVSGPPGAFRLEQNYPNPFNPATRIRYQLPSATHVKLTVVDLLGQEVSVLVNDRRDAGIHEVTFEAAELSSGIYLYRLQAGESVQTRKFLLLK
jgi:hypothetical protein